MAKQPEAQVKFSVFNKEFNEGIQEMNRESTRLRKEFRLQSEQMKNTATQAEKLEAQITYLSKDQEIVRKKIEMTNKQLEKAKQTYGENSNEANKLSNQLLDLQIKEAKLENQIQQSRAELSKLGQEMENAERKAEKFGDTLKKIGDHADSLGNKLSVGLTAPLAAVGGVAANSAMDIDSATRLMIATLGSTGKEAKQLEGDLKALWFDGFGDHPEQIARAMMLIKQNIKDIDSGEELQKITKQMLLLTEATDSDMSEATRGLNQLMHNFGITADRALDLFVKGQQEGINYSNEMFDNIAEYAPLFRDMGFSAERYFAMLSNGAQNGAYNLDYVNDILKEFNIRIQDGSKTTEEAFGSLSKEAQKLFEEFKSGEATAEDLFRAVIPELEEMEDQVLANQIGVDLFGTKFEDMGATTVYTLDDVNDAFEDTTGAMEEFAKVQEESFGHKFKRTLRGLLEAVEPVGEDLLELFEELIPYIEKAGDWFVNLDDDTKKFLLTLAGTSMAAGPAIKVFGGITNSLGNLTKSFSTADVAAGTKNGLGKTLLSLFSKAGPIGLGMGVVGGLALAIGGLVKSKKELNDVSLDTYNSLMNEYRTNDEMIRHFEELRNQSKLTQSEFERYIDLQSELQEATDPTVIEAIKGEMAELQKKSDLTNEELNTMVGLNGDLVEALPGATEKITEQGNKIAGTTSELEKYNQEISKMATLELEGEYYEALSNQQILTENLKSAQKELNGLKEREKEIANYISKYTESELATLKEKLEDELRSYKAQLMKRNLSAEERNEALKEYTIRREILELIEGGKEGLREQLLNTKKQVNEQEIQIQNIMNQQAQLGIVTDRLIEQYLTTAGISAEKARQAVLDDNAIGAIEKKISLLEEEKQKLYENTTPAERNSEIFRQGVQAIDDQIYNLKTAKTNIEGLITVANEYNKELGENIKKRVGIKYDPDPDSIDRKLKSPITKPVHIKGFPQGPYIAPTYAVGTTFHPGGPAILAEEGPELVRQGNKIGIASILGVYNLKRGADVFTAEQTEKILKGLMRLPAYADGTGLGKKLEYLTHTSENLTALNQHNILNQIKVVVEPSDVIMDGTKVGKIVWKPVKENMERSSFRNSRVPKGKSR